MRIIIIIFAYFLLQSCNVNNTNNETLKSSLLLSDSTGCIEDVNLYLKKYFYPQKLNEYCGDINDQNKFGETIIMRACYYGKDKKIVKECLNKNANIFMKDSLGLNACNYISYPNTGEPHDVKLRKNSADIIELTNIFVQFHPKKQDVIINEIIWSLIKYSSPQYNKKAYSYIINKYNPKIDYSTLKDSITYLKWQNDWK